MFDSEGLEAASDGPLPPDAFNALVLMPAGSLTPFGERAGV
jgi:hypothetical protein